MQDHRDDLINNTAATVILANLIVMAGIAIGVLAYFVFVKFGM